MRSIPNNATALVFQDMVNIVATDRIVVANRRIGATGV